MTDTKTPAASLAVRLLTVFVAVVIGGLVATQSRINGELGKELGDGYTAALISFGSGLVVLTVAMFFWKPGRVGLRRVGVSLRQGQIPWWYVCGGSAGALLVLSQGLTAAILGVALFTVASVCGQTLSGLLIDRRGIGTMPAKAITWTRLLGSALAVIAIVWSVSAEVVGDIPFWMLVLPFLAGLGQAWQQAVNGQVRGVAGSTLTATFGNFLVGTLLLAIVAIIHATLAGWPVALPSNPILYIGGCIGVTFIALAAVLVRMTGVLLLGLGTIAGQLVASLLFDLFAPVAGATVAWTTVAGTILTLLAVGLAAVPSRVIRARSETPAR